MEHTPSKEGPYRDSDNPLQAEVNDLHRQLNDYRRAGHLMSLAWETAQQEIGRQVGLREKEAEARVGAEKELRRERHHAGLMLIFCVVSALTLVYVTISYRAAFNELRSENRELRELAVELDQEAGIANLMTFGAVFLMEAELDRSDRRIAELKRQLDEERRRGERLQTRFDGLYEDYEYEHAYGNTLEIRYGVGPLGTDPFVLDDHGEICRLSQLPRAEGTCPY